MDLLKLLVLFILVVFVNGCKKENLCKNNPCLVGYYEWVSATSGWGLRSAGVDSQTFRYKIKIFGSGKYKLYNYDKKIGYGRIVKDKEENLIFKSDELFCSDFLHKKSVVCMGDQISITLPYCCDCGTNYYRKK